MSSPALRIQEQLPLYYREQAAGLITFLEKYYTWLHRDSGFSYDEIEDLKNDTSWISESVDKFIGSGSSIDLTIDSSQEEIFRAIIEYKSMRSPGSVSDNLIDEYLLERDSESYTTSEGEYFVTRDMVELESSNVNQTFLEMWYKQSGYTRPNMVDIGSVDEVLFVSLLKHINAIKGTFKSIQLFFSIYFDENNIELYIPKYDIAIIDDNWVPDQAGYLRDDRYYDEFTYEILVDNEPSTYDKLFQSIFMKHVHPAGFNVYLTKKTT